ncbi:MAG: hypothetical protein ACPGYV_09910 [Phycisphaeraceae bacterium]
MTLRYLAVVILLSAIGAGLLGLRQQQLNDKHAMAASHAQMKDDREAIKDLQVRIARLARPDALQDAIDRAKLDMQPISCGDGSLPPDPAADAASHATPDEADALDG